MDILENGNISMSKRDLKEMLSDFLRKKGYKFEKLQWKYETKLVGHPTNLHRSKRFNGVEIKATEIVEE